MLSSAYAGTHIFAPTTNGDIEEYWEGDWGGVPTDSERCRFPNRREVLVFDREEPLASVESLLSKLGAPRGFSSA